MNFKYGDSLECYREDDLRSESGGHDKLDLTKCKTIFFDHVCNKIDCGEYRNIFGGLRLFKPSL
uniref:Uncharacterized protein n=1 Tax=Meloidogyne incognita TaxID=6306 RepID=A0A914L2K3_MELIC